MVRWQIRQLFSKKIQDGIYRDSKMTPAFLYTPLSYTILARLSLLVTALGQTLLESLESLLDVASATIQHTDAHVAEADILGRDGLVDATGEHDAPGSELGEELGALDGLREIDGGHAVGLVVGVGGDLLEAERSDARLDLIRSRLVGRESFLDALGDDLGKGGMEGANELGRGSGEVGGLLGLVVLHDGKPVLHRSKVRGGGSLAALEGLDSAAAEHGDGETGRAANGLLRGSDNTVKLPGIKVDLLAGNGADTIDNDEGIGRDPVDELGKVLELAKNTGGGIDVGDGKELVLLLRKGLLDLGELRAAAGLGRDLGNVGAVDLEAVGEAIAKVTGAENESILTRLDQVGGDKIPTKGAGAGQDERLSGRVRGLEQLAQHGQGLAEDSDEARTDMALAVVTHGVKDGIVELDGAGNKEGRVLRLSRHRG